MTWTLIKEKNKTEIQEQEDFECLDLDEDGALHEKQQEQ